MCVCRLGEDEMEVGMGLHGEPGASTQKMQSANDIVKQVNISGFFLLSVDCLLHVMPVHCLQCVFLDSSQDLVVLFTGSDIFLLAAWDWFSAHCLGPCAAVFALNCLSSVDADRCCLLLHCKACLLVQSKTLVVAFLLYFG